MNVLKDILYDDLIIETERLKIYPFKINYKIISDLYAIYSNSNNVEHYCNVYNNFDEFSDYMQRKIQEHQNDINGIISFIIELKENSKIIGVRNVILDGVYTTNGYDDINNQNLITEILINQSYWKNGFATEASIEIFKFLKSRGILNVLSFVNNKNFKAKYLDEKLGFKTINLEQAYYEFDYHQDFTIHTSKIEESKILLKEL